MRLKVIKTPDRIFIYNPYEYKGYSCQKTNLLDYFFDGELPKETWKPFWIEVSKIPSKIEQEKNVRIKTQYKLVDESLESDKMPLYREDRPEILEDLYTPAHEYKKIKSAIVFSLDIIEIPSFEEGEVWEYTDKIKHQPLDKAIFPEIYLHNRPCKLSRKDSYELIRQYVKENIDLKYAKITSDYDFCFTVEKVLKLSNPEYKNFYNLGDILKKKSKPTQRYVKDRKVVVYETSPDGYNGKYPIVEEFLGKDEKELKSNIENFLKNLMEEINKPLIECACCDGTGVILENKEN